MSYDVDRIMELKEELKDERAKFLHLARLINELTSRVMNIPRDVSLGLTPDECLAELQKRLK